MRSARLLLLVAVATLGGCSVFQGSDPPATTPVAEPSPTPTFEPWVIATSTEESVDVYTRPGDAEPARTVTAAEVVSLPGQIPLTFLVLRREADWVQVSLPDDVSTGWLAAEDVTFAVTEYGIEVRVRDHELVLTDAGVVVLEVGVGIGIDVPEPGIYYLKELVQPPEVGGPYGAYAYGLAGFPPVLDRFSAGAGVIAIHGTVDASVIGTDVPRGSIHMLDADITRMFEEFGLPLGTPVEIVE